MRLRLTAMKGWPARTWRLRAVTAAAVTAAGVAAAAAAAPAAVAVPAGLSASVLAAPAQARPAHSQTRPPGRSFTPPDVPPAPSVVLAGIPGLRWSDLSPRATPNLWRLASQGSVGSLVVRTVLPRTCAVDGWLTLNAGARAMARHTGKGQCPPIAAPSALPGIAAYNQRFHYNTHWGLLAATAGPGGCVTAVGPAAALAVAGQQGQAPPYLPVAVGVSRSVIAQCPLTVLDFGALPAGHDRAAAVTADDALVGRVAAGMPPDALLAVAGLADGTSPHLRVIVVSGAGYHAGLLAATSTRQAGLVQLTDLTAAILAWRNQPVPADLVGSPLTRSDRGGFAAAVRGLIGQDTAAQVYRSTEGWFFAAFAVGDGVVFGAIMLICWGPARRARRRACARIAGTFAGAVPAGSFLAGLAPWPLLPHPAAVLYGLAVAWAAAIGAVALAGPWRRDPFGPPGMVGAITVAVVGLDVMTGSRLQLGTPFGLSTLEAGRFYGVGNNALGPYGAAGLLAAAWLARVAARRSFRWRPGALAGHGRGQPGQDADQPLGRRESGHEADAQPGRGGPGARRARRDATLAVGVVAVFTVVASGWFGSKFGGTVAMVPGFVLLGLRTAGVRVTTRRAVTLAFSGVAAVILFALANYLEPIPTHSHIGAFVGDVLHGGAGGVLQRKINSNIGSLTITPYSPLVPLVVIALGLLLLRPAWLRVRWLPGMWRQEPLLRPTLAAIWVVAVLGWLADDSGVTVAAAALPFALPLVIAIQAGIPDPARGHVAPSAAAAEEPDGYRANAPPGLRSRGAWIHAGQAVRGRGRPLP